MQRRTLTEMIGAYEHDKDLPWRVYVKHHMPMILTAREQGWTWRDIVMGLLAERGENVGVGGAETQMRAKIASVYRAWKKAVREREAKPIDNQK